MAKGSGPIQYNELFNNDVDAKLAELSGIVSKLDSEFQGLATTITAMSGKISVNIKTTNTTLEKMAADMSAVDVATRGAGDQLQAFSKDLETVTTKSRNLKDQQKGLKDTFDIATASVDEIKNRIKLLTAEYTALGRATDADKTKIASLGKEVSNLKTYIDPLVTALNKTKTAIQAADGSYNQMSKRLADLKKELLSMPNAFNPATGALNKANSAAMALHKEISQLDTALKKADASMGMFGRNVGNYKSALGGALNSITSLALGYVSLQSAITLAGKSFTANMELSAIKSSLSFTLGSVEAADEKLKELRVTADNLGLSLTPLAETYAKFAGAARAANFPIEQTDKIFKSVSGAAARFNLTSDQLTGALLALQQMISKGTVQAEELRGQLSERLPGAFSIAAQAMGKTEKELGKLLETGQVTASELLPKLAEQLDKTFKLDTTTRIDNLTASTNKLSTSFDTMLQGDGIGKVFKSIVDGARAALEGIDQLIKSRSWSEAFSRIFTFDGGEKYRAINSITDNVASSKATRKDYNPVGADSKTMIGTMTDKPLAELEILRRSYIKATQQAADAVNTYRAGIKSGLLKDGGKNSFKDVEDNFNKMQAILTQVNTAYKIVEAKTPKIIAGNKELADSELTSVAAIRKRITELSKLDGSATKGSDIYNRIAALRQMLKDGDAERKRAESEREAAAKKAIKDADDLLKAQTKLNISALERQEITDLSTATEEQKTAIIIKFEKDKLKVIEDGINAREKLYKKGTVDYIELEVEKQKATVDAQEKIAKATEDGLKRQQALQEKYAKLRDDLLASQGQGAYAAEEFKINSTVYKGNPQQQEAQKQDALFNLRNDALKRELTLVDLRYAHIKDATERELTIKREKQDITNELDQLGYDNFIRLQGLQKAKLDEMFSYLRDNSSIIGQLYGQGFGDLFDSLTTNLQKMVEGTGNTLADWAETIKAGARAANDVFRQGSEERISMLEEEKNQQMEIAGSNKDARLAIEKAFNDKIKAEKRKQAGIDKATAIFEIAINTAVAASKATAQTGIFGLPLAAVLIAFGAIQAGLVAAKPLPAFRTGTQNAPEGFARVGEEGAELIESRRGNMRIAHSDQVTYLERGDKVYTAAQTRKILDTAQIDSNTELHGRLATNLHQQSSQQRVREMAIAFRQDPEAIGDAVGRKIKDLPIHQTYFDERGVSRFIRKNGTITKYLNDRTSLS